MPSSNTKQIGAHLCEYKLIRILVKSASIMYFEYPKIYVCMLIEVELLVVDMLLLLVPTTSNNIFLLYVLMVLNLQDKFVFKLCIIICNVVSMFVFLSFVLKELVPKCVCMEGCNLFSSCMNFMLSCN